MGRKTEELRNKSAEELLKDLNQVEEELFKLRKTVMSGGALEKPGRFKVLKKTKARILTILREKGVKL